MQKVNAQPVDLRAKLAKTVKPGLAAAPIIVVEPVLSERTDFVERCPLRPVVDCFPIGPARAE